MNELDEKIKRIFPEESVFKSPKEYRMFSGYNLPSFVKDWILRKFTDEFGNLDVDALKLFLLVLEKLYHHIHGLLMAT